MTLTITFLCDHCGTEITRATKDFYRTARRGGHHVCSRACNAAIRARPENRLTYPCANCGTLVTRFKSQMRSGETNTFCSQDCRNAYGRIEVTCMWPGCSHLVLCRKWEGKDSRNGKTRTGFQKDFARNPKFRTFILCDVHDEKLLKFIGPNRMTWRRATILSDENHVFPDRALSSKFNRFFLFDRAGEQCEGCYCTLDFAETKTWNVDHRVPVFRGGKTTLSNLQILCKKCHDVKTAPEKSEVVKLRHTRTKLSRWQTHTEKDELIDRLRAKLVAFGVSTVELD